MKPVDCLNGQTFLRTVSEFLVHWVGTLTKFKNFQWEGYARNFLFTNLDFLWYSCNYMLPAPNLKPQLDATALVQFFIWIEGISLSQFQQYFHGSRSPPINKRALFGLPGITFCTTVLLTRFLGWNVQCSWKTV